MRSPPEIIPINKAEPALREEINKLAKELQSLIERELEDFKNLEVLVRKSDDKVTIQQIPALLAIRKKINARVEELNQNINKYNALKDVTPIHSNTLHFTNMFTDLSNLPLYSQSSEKVANSIPPYHEEYFAELRLPAASPEGQRLSNSGTKPAVVTAPFATDAATVAAAPSVSPESPSSGAPGAPAQSKGSSVAVSQPSVSSSLVTDKPDVATTVQPMQDPNENLAKKLAPLVEKIKIDLLELRSLREAQQKAIRLVEDSVANGGHDLPSAYRELERNSKAVKNKERQINQKLIGLELEDIRHIQHKTGIGKITDNEIEASHPKLSDNANKQVQAMRTGHVEGLITAINSLKVQLNAFLEDEKKTVDELERQFKANKVEVATLNHAKAVTKQLDRLRTEINEKIIALDPTSDEMSLIINKTRLTFNNFNQLLLPPAPYEDDRVKALVNNPEPPTPAPLQPIQPPPAPPLPLKPAAHTVPPTSGSFPLGPSVNPPPSPPSPAVAMQSQAHHTEVRSAEARIGGTVISSDWLTKRQLAASINSSIRQGMETAMMQDPEFTKLNTKLHINDVHLSTPGVSSSGLKGLKIISDDKKIDFTATPESVNGNGNLENLRAMSIAIVKNLETRIANGETNLKINLGNCQPQTVKDEFSKLINEQLDLMSMQPRNQSNPRFAAYDIQALKLPETPQVKASAVINESTLTAPTLPSSATTSTTPGKPNEAGSGAIPAPQHVAATSGSTGELTPRGYTPT